MPHRLPPSLAEIEALAEHALGTIPRQLKPHLGRVVIRVPDPARTKVLRRRMRHRSSVSKSPEPLSKSGRAWKAFTLEIGWGWPGCTMPAATVNIALQVVRICVWLSKIRVILSTEAMPNIC